MKLSEYTSLIKHRKFGDPSALYSPIAIRSSIGEAFVTWRCVLENKGNISEHLRNELVEKLGDIFSWFCLDRKEHKKDMTAAKMEGYFAPDIKIMIALQRDRLGRFAHPAEPKPEVSLALLTLFEGASVLKDQPRTFLTAYLTVLKLLNISLEEVVTSNAGHL